MKVRVSSVTVTLLIALLWVYPSFAQVALDNSTGFESQSNPISTFFTVGSGSNRQIAVYVFNGCNSGQTAPTVTSITVSGTSLTQIVADTSQTSRNGYLYAWPTGSQPATGSDTVVVNLTGDIFSTCSTVAQTNIGIISVTGVDQSTTFSSSNNAHNSSSANPSVTISSSGANDLVIHSVCGGSTVSAPTGTSRWIQGDEDTSCNSNGGATASGGTTTLSWTMAADSWIDIAASFKAATGGCTPSKLAFTAQPSNAVIGASLGTVTVNVQDAGGSNCTSDTSTITITNNAGCTGMTLGGTTSGANVLTTTNLTENVAGTCTLHAADGSLTAADSSSFTVSAATAAAKRSLLGVGR